MANVLVQRAPDAPMEFEVDGDVTLYPSGTEEALLLNATASQIWHRLATPARVDGLVAEVAASADRPVAEVAPHVIALLELLVSRGLLVADDEPAWAG